MLGPDKQAVVVISPLAGEQVAYIAIGTGALRLPSEAWKPLPRLSRLGIDDLLFAKPKTSDHPVFNVSLDGRNDTLAALTLGTSPGSLCFGISDHVVLGGVAFTFADGSDKSASKAVLEPLEAFIADHMARLRSAGPDGIVEAREAHEQFNAQTFKAYFKRYRADMASRYPDKGWQKIKCPAVTPVENCETCGAAGADQVMQVCGRCRGVRYCGRECQAADWRTHKPFCSSR